MEPPTHLDPGLFLARQIKVSTPDSTRHFFPQPPALPLALLGNRLDRDFFFGETRIEESLARFGRSDVGYTRPLSFVGLNGGPVLANGRFERVGFTGEVTFAFVVDLTSALEVRASQSDSLTCDIKRSTRLA